MSYEELRRTGAVVRPWSRPKPREGKRTSPFTASLSSTVRLLVTELRALEARNVVLELDVQERELRTDGLPRANARPSYPGVAVAFESKYGPLRYETAEYDRAPWRGGEAWHANLRAIALSMEALRAVDRHGVSRRGEQYVGWRELPQSTDAADQVRTREQAEDLLASYGGLVEALKATHPDRGGDPDDFRRVMRAKELVG